MVTHGRKLYIKDVRISVVDSHYAGARSFTRNLAGRRFDNTEWLFKRYDRKWRLLAIGGDICDAVRFAVVRDLYGSRACKRR
jgi:hypothetical protein